MVVFLLLPRNDCRTWFGVASVDLADTRRAVSSFDETGCD